MMHTNYGNVCVSKTITKEQNMQFYQGQQSINLTCHNLKCQMSPQTPSNAAAVEPAMRDKYLCTKSREANLYTSTSQLRYTV